MADIPSKIKKEVIGLVEAQAKSIDSISERLVKVEESVAKQESSNEKQDSRNRDIIIAVLLAFVAIVVTIALQIFFSNKSDEQFYSNLEKDVYSQDLKVQGIQNDVDNIKIRNSYLK
jgi:hypothetical protein